MPFAPRPPTKPLTTPSHHRSCSLVWVGLTALGLALVVTGSPELARAEPAPSPAAAPPTPGAAPAEPPNSGAPPEADHAPAAEGAGPQASGPTAVVEEAGATEDAKLRERAPVQSHDGAQSALEDAALDLGITLSYGQALWSSSVDEAQLVGEAKRGWAVLVALEPRDANLRLRLFAVAPGEDVVRVKVETIRPRDVQRSVVRNLRDVLASVHPKQAPPHAAEPPPAPARSGMEDSARADGRAYLAVTGALVGGYVGFAMEHIAGSSDARLTYPLMTLGAGIGVASSLIAADEWQVTSAEAVYLSAGTLWSTSSALLITDGLSLEGERRRPSHRHAYGLIGTATGLSLGTLAISTSEITHGGALLTHSGAVFGGLFGVLTQRMIEPRIEERPTLGLGLGLGLGTLGAGFVATQIDGPSPARLVYIDLAAFLGGLTGAALATPAIVGTDVTEMETRVWFGSIFAGTVAGAALGTLITAGDTPDESTQPSGLTDLRPVLSPLAPLERNSRPSWTVGVAGSW